MESHDNRSFSMERSPGNHKVCTNPMVLDLFVFGLNDIKIVQLASHNAGIVVCVSRGSKLLLRKLVNYSTTPGLAGSCY